MIDYVLITHNHQDHILFETMLQLRHKVGNDRGPAQRRRRAAGPVPALMLQQIGFHNVIELDEMETLTLAGLLDHRRSPFSASTPT